MTIKVGVLVAGHIDDPHVSQYKGYAEMFRRLFRLVNAPFEYQVYYVCDEQWPDTVDSCDAWLITGSASGVYEATPWMLNLIKWVKQCYDNEIPMVGICFGHQIIAQALGGVVEKFPKGWSVGPQTYKLCNTRNTHGTFTLNAVHQDQVIVKPPQAMCIATSDFCQYAALMYGRNILTIQAHPEFTIEYERDLLQYHSGKAIPEDVVSSALHELSLPISLDETKIASLMVQVLSNRPSII